MQHGLGPSWQEQRLSSSAQALYVISGRGTMRMGSERLPVAPGDFFSFLTGRDDTAHQLLNTSNETLQYLVFSTNSGLDICG